MDEERLFAIFAQGSMTVETILDLFNMEVDPDAIVSRAFAESGEKIVPILYDFEAHLRRPTAWARLLEDSL